MNQRNISRHYEHDLLRALAIISMIICHSVIQFSKHRSGYEDDIPYLVGERFFGGYLAVAHAFMFIMGVGIVYSRRNKPRNLIRRGILLFIMGYVLNFCRYGVYALADGLIEGEFMADTVYALVASDIFHFAGLALIATGVLKHFNLDEKQIFVVALASSALGGMLAFTYQGTTVTNFLLGHFIVTTKRESCFAFLNWYIFVGFGILFGTILRKVEEPDRFYGRLFCVALPVMLLYIALSVRYGTFFLTKNGWYYATSLPESAGLLSIDLTLLCVFHFLLKKIEVSRLSLFIMMSRNVTEIYWIQWCVIGFVDSIFCYFFGIVFPYWFIYVFGIALVFISYWIARRWECRDKAK